MTAAKDMPASWQLAWLKLIVPLQYGKALSKNNRGTGRYPVYGSAGITGWHSAPLTTGPTILVGRKGAAGRVEFASEPCWPIDTVYYSYGNPLVELKFYLHYLRYVNLGKFDQSTAIPSLSRDVYNLQQAPLPPLAEQRRIVAKLDELFSDLDAATAALERVQANLKRYRASVLKSAVEGKLTAEWRAKNPPKETGAQLLERILKERRAKWEENQLAKFKAQGKEPPKDWQKKYPEPVKPDTANLPELPEGWVWATVDMVLHGIEAGKSFRCIERPPNEGEVGIVKVSAVSWGQYKEEESKTCHSTKSLRKEYLVQAGDFLFSRANTIELVGACVIVEHTSRQIMLSDKILRLRVCAGLDRWLLSVLRSTYGRKAIQKASTGNQDSMRNIGQEKLRYIPIPLPPFMEIEAVSDTLQEAFSDIQRAEQTIQLRKQTLKNLRQSTLKTAFEGKLVPQDPNDEPASELLKRIREAREQQETAAAGARQERKAKADGQAKKAAKGKAKPK